MVAVNDMNKDMLRFLWLKEPNDPNSELVQMRFARLVFGLRPSPAILSSTIRHHLETQKEFEPQLIEQLKKSLYVDDFVSGADSENEASEVASKAKLIMQKEAFNLRKWNTNSSNLKKMFAEEASPIITNVKSVKEDNESYAKAVTGITIKANSNTVKVLGTIWNTASDSLEFEFSDLLKEAKVLPPTKRSLLKCPCQKMGFCIFEIYR
jgi:hypothetical protein